MRFPIPAFSWADLALLLVIGVMPLIACGVLAWWVEKGRIGRFSLLGSLLLGAIIPAVACWQMRAMQLRVTADALVLEAGIYRHTVALQDLQLERSQILPCNALGKWMSWRSNGIGLPHLQAGWFRGDEGRVFAAIGTGGQCVLLPGNEGTTLILSPQEPEKLLAVLHQQVVDRR